MGLRMYEMCSGLARTDTDGVVIAAGWHGLIRTDTD